MKIALVSDEWHDINQYIMNWLDEKKYEYICFGSYSSKKDENWVEVTVEAAKAVSDGTCDQGIFSCWSGTGASIVANKINRIRAALCNDPETVELARIWNNANILVLSNRTLTKRKAKLMLIKWFLNYDITEGLRSSEQIEALE